MTTYQPLNMALTAFDTSFAAVDVADIPRESTPIYVTDAQSRGYIDLGTIRQLYRFETDSNDLTDVSGDDIKFHTNVGAVVGSLNPLLTTVDAGSINGNVNTLNGLVYHDFIRHLALELFGRHEVADMFNNEKALKNSLFNSGQTIDAEIRNKINNADNLDVSDESPDNLVYSLLKQMLNAQPQRFENTNDSNLFDASLNDGVPSCLPFVVGDSISFKLEIFPNANQATTIFSGDTSVVVNPRSYEIVLEVVDDGLAETMNPQQSDITNDLSA